MNASLAADLNCLRLALADSATLKDLEKAESQLNEDPTAKAAYSRLQSLEEKLNLNPNDSAIMSELSMVKKELDQLPSARAYMAAYLRYCALIDKVNANLFFGSGLLMRYKGC